MFACMNEGELATMNVLLDKLASHIGGARRDTAERSPLGDPLAGIRTIA